MSLTCPTCNKNNNIVHRRTLTPFFREPFEQTTRNANLGHSSYSDTEIVPYPGIIRLENYKCKNCGTKIVTRIIVVDGEETERRQFCGIATSITTSKFLADCIASNFGSRTKVDYVYHLGG